MQHVWGRGAVDKSILMWKHEGNSKFGRPRRTWKDNITIDLKEVGWGVDQIHLAQDRDS